MSVVIRVDTGFVGGVHEQDTDLSVEEWNALSDGERSGWKLEVVWDHIDVFAVDEDNEDTELS